MLRTIKQVSEETGIPASAIRFYDRHGLLPAGQRDEHGYRVFDDAAVRELYIVDYMRLADMPVRTIRRFADWCDGDGGSIRERLDAFDDHYEQVRRRIGELTDALAILDESRARCRQALADGVDDETFRILNETAMIDTVQNMRRKRQNMQ
ncbi:MerR family transcriptional regulator [Bifidobacterium samirii]|uniref:Transcriptional regulator MerR family n=1 Tax=Bifidobacterium samirii TaxID=2306974 RepID=A0A430FV55_9BIFI|nr:MerR family transcriptional regulator [Bifidobacterium samirii]RSX57434.1 transcriptional regulator MerR family [Bifidobacterium samirii]